MPTVTEIEVSIGRACASSALNSSRLRDKRKTVKQEHDDARAARVNAR
jgi:hypothetical protein